MPCEVSLVLLLLPWASQPSKSRSTHTANSASRLPATSDLPYPCCVLVPLVV